MSRRVVGKWHMPLLELRLPYRSWPEQLGAKVRFSATLTRSPKAWTLLHDSARLWRLWHVPHPHPPQFTSTAKRTSYLETHKKW